MKTQRIALFGALAALGALALLAVPARAADAPAGADPLLNSLIQRPGILAQALKLTPAQTDTLKTLIASLKTATRTLNAANDSLDQQIRTAVNSLAPDNCAIGKLVLDRHKNDVAIAAAFAKFDHDFSAILTPEQLVKYQRLKTLLNHSGKAATEEETGG